MKRRLSIVFGFIITALLTCIVSYNSNSFSTYVDVEERMVVDTSKTPFMDGNLKCYPLVKENPSDPDTVAVGWGLTSAEAQGLSITIPVSVEDENNTSYTVKAIVKSGFRYCGFNTITFANNSEVEEIQKEAFYSCQNITTFTLPSKCVYGISSSAFMDCRKLEKVVTTNVVNYINSQISNWDNLSSADKTWLDNHPYDIGDHAFSSCVKLKGFSFPTTLRQIGDSAFHNCPNIYGIFFPANNGYTKIEHIGKYAFADCTNFAICHFEKNIVYIDEYAFTECNKLKIYYQGNISDPNDPMNAFSEVFRKKHVATNMVHITNDYVPIEYGVSAMAMDDDHPGLIYTKQPGPIRYNGSKNSDISASKYILDSSTDEYVTIFQWKTPTVTSDDYDAENAILTIPNTIAGAPVKKILRYAFYDINNENVPLNGIVFNASLVQIEKEAFKNCNKLATIDFSDCVALQEIGHNAFDGSSANKAFTGKLSLPNSLKYIGNKAFYNFTKATDLELFDSTKTPNLKIIGNNAFENFGKEVADNKKGQLDLLLPRTLTDYSATQLVPVDISNNVCVGNRAFANCPLLRTVTMQPFAGNPATGSEYSSFGTSAFSTCVNLLSFKANKALYMLGDGIFEKDPMLKEIFLSTFMGAKKTKAFWWGIGEGNSLFFRENDTDDVEFRDLVIYVDGKSEPSRQTRQEKYFVWNSDPRTYVDEYSTSANTENYVPYQNTSGNSNIKVDSVVGRPVIPTYYNVNFHTAGNVKYIDVTSGTVSNTPDYTNSVASIKMNNKDEYILTKCYAANKESIDMSSWNPGYSITTIGPSSFATNSSGNPSQKYILPSTVTTIRDRAFYSVDTDGVNIITYKSGGNEVGGSGNRCYLPSGVTRLERYSFYNNDFLKVALPSGLSFLGNSSFIGSPGKASSITEFSIESGTSDYYTYSNNGIYDTSSRTLLYQIGSSATALDLSSLTIGGGTLNAIGQRALAGSSYTSVTLPSTCEMIYGGAFQRSSITSVTGLSGLTYIASMPAPGDNKPYYDKNNGCYSENFDFSDLAQKDAGSDQTPPPTDGYIEPQSESGENVHVANYANRPDYFNWYNRFGAFAYCTNLATFDFTSCSSTIKKIGYGAFEGCTNLENLTDGSTTYNYYRYSDFTGLTKSNVTTKIAEQGAIKDSKTSGVLDLSDAENLTAIERGAFKNCSKIKYVHLPMLEDQNVSKTEQAGLYLGMNYDDRGSWYSRSPKVDKGKESVFAGTAAVSQSSGGAILVGEGANFASTLGDKYNSAKSVGGETGEMASIDYWDKTSYLIDRYPTYTLSSTTTYFYVRSDASSYTTTDLVENQSGTAVRYWIYIGGDETSHNYLLFDTKKQLTDYFK